VKGKRLTPAVWAIDRLETFPAQELVGVYPTETTMLGRHHTL